MISAMISFNLLFFLVKKSVFPPNAIIISGLTGLFCYFSITFVQRISKKKISLNVAKKEK